MRHRGLATICAAAAGVAALLWAPPFVAAQTRPASQPKAGTGPATAKTWTVPRTPDGQPDLQGYFTNPNFTPLERPARFAGKEFFTDEEEADFYKAAIEYSYEFTFENSAETPVYDATVYALDRWQIGARPNKRTSLIVDPPDGKIPPRTPAGAARVAASKPKTTLNGPEDLPARTRCMGGGPEMIGTGYRSQYQIVQSRDYVVIVFEHMHNVRVIPLDGRAHLPRGLTRTVGDSRGHWEGDSLVVETTNIAAEDRLIGSSTALRLVERFTRTGPDTIVYKMTADDPATWTKPWTAEVPLLQIEGPIFEYACHEGNNGLINMLQGARVQERAAADALQKGSK
jgi:hypothetical protein